MAKRRCTTDYKINAINNATRKAFNLNKLHLTDNFISMWLGISIDEIDRVKDSYKNYINHKYPLIELNMTRQDCMEYCNKYNWKATKSRCYFCPYQSDSNWLDLKQNSKNEFELACLEDERLRNVFLNHNSKAYLHRSCKPLREVIFKDSNNDKDGFVNECQGICNT